MAGAGRGPKSDQQLARRALGDLGQQHRQVMDVKIVADSDEIRWQDSGVVTVKELLDQLLAYLGAGAAERLVRPD